MIVYQDGFTRLWFAFWRSDLIFKKQFNLWLWRLFVQNAQKVVRIKTQLVGMSKMWKSFGIFFRLFRIRYSFPYSMRTLKTTQQWSVKQFMSVITLKGFHLCNSNNNAVIAMCELCNYWFLRKNLQIVVKYAVIQDFTFCVFCLNQPSSLSLLAMISSQNIWVRYKGRCQYFLMRETWNISRLWQDEYIERSKVSHPSVLIAKSSSFWHKGQRNEISLWTHLNHFCF